ncbi:hypothetical protein C882_3096 [Caenispirillum salinarum AK4]|uniref:CHRD domain-containing protein n=1 Tax=Caenispirillum salinarum AK4 TaxID=1238182 RepID=K9H393_9PROT|nr:hypothetical protein [Caenispirillum salinarum]EKV32032.1 hypothetical protein C882_3096 [Caenispirillum salinarum AK4]
MIKPAATAAALALTAAAAQAPALAQETQQQQDQQQRQDYLGTLQAMNGSSLSGMVAFKTTDEGRLIASLGASDMSPGMHMAHIHGFTGEPPKDATCPTDDADANDDGLIDLIETEAVAGTTLVPLTADPASLTIKGAKGYPRADQDGSVLYLETADIQALEQALRKAHGTPLALEKRVVFVHGLPDGVDVPDSARSLPEVPARLTLPIACAEIEVKPIED